MPSQIQAENCPRISTRILSLISPFENNCLDQFEKDWKFIFLDQPDGDYGDGTSL